MYHALGYGTISYIQAIMTFDPDDITEAIKCVKNSIEVANRFRRRGTMIESMSKMVRRPNYDNYTDGKKVSNDLMIVLRNTSNNHLVSILN